MIDPDEGIIMPYTLNENGFYEQEALYDLREEFFLKVLDGCKICLKELYEENKELFDRIPEKYNAKDIER